MQLSKTLENVQAVYSGPEGRLWELIMGEQIHIGGLQSSKDLAARAGIKPQMTGVDLCCCTGAGMRFLVQFCKAARMTGVDATPYVIELGRQRTQSLGLSDRINFVHANSCRTGLDSSSVDFVWGEDAWCYVEDKPSLISEAARIVKPGGIIAFTDWVQGPGPITAAELGRFNTFMKFPNIEMISGYSNLLAKSGCSVIAAADTGRFAPCVDFYLQMLSMQHTYDALKIINFDEALFMSLAGEMQFVQKLAHENKIIQGLFVARRNGK